MFCDRCGARIDGPANFCPGCGRTFNPAPPVSMAGRGGRVMRNVRTLGILWMVYAGFRLIGAMAVGSLSYINWNFWDNDIPFFVPGLMRAIGGFLLVAGVLGAMAGWGLMERRPWARMLAIVLGVLALFKVPFGTALGIYTLWVLAPSECEAEYRAIQQG